MIDDEKINEASRKAHDAFWDVIAKHYPEIKTDDADINEALKLGEAMDRAVSSRLKNKLK